MKNSFYQEIITEKSWIILQKLKKEIDFILIGGWAVYLYSHNLKSKDIDIVIDYNGLYTLRKNYELSRNESLKKYEIKKEGIDIDIYLPYYSDVGFPLEEISKYVQSTEGFKVPKPEVFLITKLKAYQSRKASIKGQKDKIDIISLIFLEDFDFAFFQNILEKYNLKEHKNIIEKILKESAEVKELGLSRHFFSKKKKMILNKLIYKQGVPL